MKTQTISILANHPRGRKEIDDIAKAGNYHRSKCLSRLRGFNQADLNWPLNLENRKRVSVSAGGQSGVNLVVKKKIQFPPC